MQKIHILLTYDMIPYIQPHVQQNLFDRAHLLQLSNNIITLYILSMGDYKSVYNYYFMKNL